MPGQSKNVEPFARKHGQSKRKYVVHKKRASNQPSGSTPKRSRVSNLSLNQTHSNSFYYNLSFEYFTKTLTDRDFIFELSFTNSGYHELGFIAYLESRNLSI